MAEEEGANPEDGRVPVARMAHSSSATSTPEELDFQHNVRVDDSETVSPLMLGRSQEVDEFSLDGGHPAEKGSKRKTHRSPREWLHNRFTRSPRASPSMAPSASGSSNSAFPQYTPLNEDQQAKDIVVQAMEWLELEKKKRRMRKKMTQRKSKDGLAVIDEIAQPNGKTGQRSRRGSSDSDSSTALEQLEEILKKGASLGGVQRKVSSRRSRLHRKPSSMMRLRRHSTTGGSSDTGTDQPEKTISVPTCDAWLDNSKTLSRTTGLSAIDEAGNLYVESMSQRERSAWSNFQYEILRIAHTLQLRRWRRVPLSRSDDIVVERLSGALTNAVYTVSPPANLELKSPSTGDKSENTDSQGHSKSRPKILLLRIYGPQVEHLVDRDSELQILRRLGHQNIGPCLLGTFNNGRFEEYLYAKALKPEDLHNQEISNQIAKRMRELHDGIALTPEERKSGPFVWRNWDKWLARCEKIVSYMDGQVEARGPTSPAVARLRQRGYVCGTPWPMFKQAIERYRGVVKNVYGGDDGLKGELLFCHNDTQYGNILRQEPAVESPLLLPANIHKQLVVIDFEYANANTRGLEFANHFTEWCYNYHHPESSFEVQTALYPTVEEQQRFIHAYLVHQPQFAPAASKPNLLRNNSSASSISTLGPQGRAPSLSFLERQVSNSSMRTMSLTEPALQLSETSPRKSSILARNDAAQSIKDNNALEKEILRLIQETRLWRIANSAQWIAWGIVQARVPGLGNAPHNQIVHDTATDWTQGDVKADSEDGEEHSTSRDEDNEDIEFDYLSYARSRAMFFWGDCVQQGFVKKEDLPEDVRRGLKIVNY